MPQAIPSYLIAIAVGDLTFKSMSARTGVWAEPSMVEAAAREFDDTEQMIQVTEKLYGPYRWGRYDLLVLPPSFPFGGMENPRLTFATPTVIAGDKSLVSLVAHELAHSWSGNLVTNATWTDFWLNEGFTTYLERRIVEAVYGKPRADMEAMIGLKDLEDSRKTIDVPKDRTLLPDLTGRDPDDAYSTVPYEQGALFLTFLEAKFGRARFDAFLRRWFDGHAFQSATTEDFLAALRTELMAKKPEAITDAQVQEWLHSETVPAFAVLPTSDAFAKVEAARDAWLKGGPIDARRRRRGVLVDAGMGALRRQPARPSTAAQGAPATSGRKMEAARLAALDKRFRLTASTNAEIAHVWFRLAIANQYTAAYGAMEQYMLHIGRRKLILPLYRDLAATPAGLTVAKRIYEKARAGYHPLAQSAIDDVLKNAGPKVRPPRRPDDGGLQCPPTTSVALAPPESRSPIAPCCSRPSSTSSPRIWPNPYSATHTFTPARRAVSTSIIESPTSHVAAGVTPASSISHSSPAGSGLRVNPESPPITRVNRDARSNASSSRRLGASGLFVSTARRSDEARARTVASMPLYGLV